MAGGFGGIIGRLPQRLRAQGGTVAPYTAEMAMLSGGMDWAHGDPFDRMVAATAIEPACPLISVDSAFDTLEAFPGWCGRIWNIAPNDP